MTKLINLIEKNFGRLTVIKRAENNKRNQPVWTCKCSCGTILNIQGRSLRSKNTLSCGCLRQELSAKRNKNLFTKHGLSDHPMYSIWSSMMARCYNKNHLAYKNYGGRDITVCKEWRDLSNFLKDMENTYKSGLTLERKNNSENYRLSNCKWATYTEQNNNRRDNVKYHYKGQYLTLAQWSRQSGVNIGALTKRIKNLKWTIEKSIETPVRKFTK